MPPVQGSRRHWRFPFRSLNAGVGDPAYHSGSCLRILALVLAGALLFAGSAKRGKVSLASGMLRQFYFLSFSES